MPSPHLPSLHQLGQAVLIGIYTAVMSFLAGLVGQGIDLEHLPDWRLGAMAGISAALAFLGWAGYSSSTRRQP